MYHYTESCLSHVYLVNGFNIEVIDGEEYTSIDNMNGLHNIIAQAIVDSSSPLTNEQFKFLRVELNLSQRSLAISFGVDEQTIARYEKNKTKIPRTTDASLRSIYMESLDKKNLLVTFLNYWPMLKRLQKKFA